MSAEEKEQKMKNEEIDLQIKQDKTTAQNEIKMLLLGMYHI